MKLLIVNILIPRMSDTLNFFGAVVVEIGIYMKKVFLPIKPTSPVPLN